VADTRLLYDLLYNTFDEDVSDWVKEFPGSLKFGPDVVERFVEKHNLDFIVTGSRHPPNGYEFSVGRKLLALASAPRPWIQSAIMSIHQNRVCTLHVSPAARILCARGKMDLLTTDHFAIKCRSGAF